MKGASGSACKPKVPSGDHDDGMSLEESKGFDHDSWNNAEEENNNMGYDDDGDVEMKNEDEEEDDPWGLDGDEDDENEYKKIAQQNIMME